MLVLYQLPNSAQMGIQGGKMTQIILLLVLMTGSIVLCAFEQKEFEVALPITCSSIVLVLFLSGILGVLNIGVYFVLAATGILWIGSLVHIIKKKTWKKFMVDFITPGFFVFIIIYFMLSFLSRDMMVTEWDEFSHWADIVKVMVTINDFGTNPDAGSLFASYTPGIALFQYFFQKIYILVKPEELFSEWRLYFSYQIFFVSLLMPFFRKVSFREPLKIILLGVIIWLAPMLIFTNVYSSIYVDAILGFLAGTAFARVFTQKEKDWVYDLYMWLSMSMLVLAKDAGMLFAVCLLGVYIIDVVFNRNEKTGAFIILKSNVVRIVPGILATMLPKFLWSYNIKINEATVSFGDKIDFLELIRIFLGLEPENYRSSVLELYSIAFLSQKMEIGNELIEIPYVVLFAIFIGIVYWLYLKYKSMEPENHVIHKTVIWSLILESVFFVVGMCVSYMFKFSENEALTLAGFSRYMKIIFHCWWIFILMLIVDFSLRSDSKKARIEIFAFCLIMSVLPWSTISLNVTRKTVENSIAKRSSYQNLINQIETITKNDEEPSYVTVICQESQGYEQLLFRYALRPHKVDWKYSIGEPFYEGDGFTETITAEKWQERLVSKRDYVALYKINDYFVEEFSDVFKNADEIMENGLYRVNKETGLLELCDIPQ